jgi:hypothetical protein
MTYTAQQMGICSYCGEMVTKRGVAKHLSVCNGRKIVLEKAERRKGNPETLLHLRAEDAYRKEFWFDIEMRASATLKQLDSYLRAIWLECCGHMSEFMAGSGRMPGRTVAKRYTGDEVFGEYKQLLHIYDFGTSSETTIKFVSLREGKPTTKNPIALLARNVMPEASCIECGKSAEWLCMECLIEDEEWGTLCGEHADTHLHGNYGEPVRLVNSPRLGMCGYAGPAVPPY